MDVILDNAETERQFQEILSGIRRLKNGETVARMKALGAVYRISWGASVVSLRELAGRYAKSHLLALKLWNKQWRETMILATLLEDPEFLSEEQMDYWTKNFETAELSEQAVANLYVHSPLAFAKALEYCCGKKHWVRYTGLLLMGRLARFDRQAINELFEGFFELLPPLMKDASLADVCYRSLLLLAGRNGQLRRQVLDFLEPVKSGESEQAARLAEILTEELKPLEG
ncbi:MAG: DNA alkylation repair protein [Mangrovibacterium sp.]